MTIFDQIKLAGETIKEAVELDKAFKRFTKHKKTKHGYKVDCVMGFWGVIAPTKEEALREARHYFRQYFDDGEYDDPVDELL